MMETGANYIKFLAIRVSADGEIDDTIEVISTEIEVIDRTTDPLRRPRKSIIDDIKIFHDEAARKKLARGIMLIGSIFILLSGILLIVSLKMSKNIDEVGKTCFISWGRWYHRCLPNLPYFSGAFFLLS